MAVARGKKSVTCTCSKCLRPSSVVWLCGNTLPIPGAPTTGRLHWPEGRTRAGDRREDEERRGCICRNLRQGLLDIRNTSREKNVDRWKSSEELLERITSIKLSSFAKWAQQILCFMSWILLLLLMEKCVFLPRMMNYLHRVTANKIAYPEGLLQCHTVSLRVSTQ